MEHSVIGMDIAKKVFQLHTGDSCTGRIERITLRRDEVLAFFAIYPTSLVALEACGHVSHLGLQARRGNALVDHLSPVA